MNNSQEIDKIAGALVQAQTAMPPVTKSCKNDYSGIAYSNVDDYIAAASPVMAANGLAILVSYEKAEGLRPSTSKAGQTQNRVRVYGTMRILHTSGQWIEIGIAGEGEDHSNFATSIAQTIARKGGYAAAFNMTSDDEIPTQPAQPQPQTYQQPRQQPQPQSQNAPPPSGDGYANIITEGGVSKATLTPIACNFLKTGTNAKGKWSLYKAEFAEPLRSGEQLVISLFDGGDTAWSNVFNQAMSTGAMVHVEWTTNDMGNTLKAATLSSTGGQHQSPAPQPQPKAQPIPDDDIPF